MMRQKWTKILYKYNRYIDVFKYLNYIIKQIFIERKRLCQMVPNHFLSIHLYIGGSFCSDSMCFTTHYNDMEFY